jgi:uncharacterized protein
LKKILVLLSGILLALLCCVSYANITIHENVNTLQTEANDGNARAQFLLGHYYIHDLNNPKQGVYWYKKSADQNYPLALDVMSTLYLSGYGVSLNYKKVYYYAKKGADLGQPISESNLGFLYYGGNYVKKNLKKAKKLFEKSAGQGSALGMFNLGQVYFFGSGAIKNVKKGLAFFNQSALKGYPDSQAAIGKIYASGPKYGLRQNIPLAYMWLSIGRINGSKAAKKSFLLNNLNLLNKAKYCIAQGQANVGVMYSKGLAGLPKDGEKAMEWLQRANETDPNLAGIQLNLSKFYYAGIGTEQDTALAFHYAKKAAKQPFGPAQQYLAQFYFNGVATKCDLVKAYAWLLKAKYTYEHPDTKFYSQYIPHCRPSYEGDALQNAKTAQAQMDAIRPHLTSAELSKAIELEKTLK